MQIYSFHQDWMQEKNLEYNLYILRDIYIKMWFQSNFEDCLASVLYKYLIFSDGFHASADVRP